MSRIFVHDWNDVVALAARDYVVELRRHPPHMGLLAKTLDKLCWMVDAQRNGWRPETYQEPTDLPHGLACDAGHS